MSCPRRGERFYDIHVRTPSDTTQKALNYIGELTASSYHTRQAGALNGGRPRQEKARPTACKTYEAWLKGEAQHAVVEVRYS